MSDATIDCTVVIPAWNASAFIGTAIRSAFSQTGLGIEIIVVDDCSTDDTAAVVAAIDDDRVKLLRRTRNGGAAAARNDGFAAARGRWIAVLDADDQLEPDRLARLVHEADRRGSDLVADNLWCDDGRSRTLHIPEQLDGGLEQISLEELYRAAVMYAGGREYGYLKPLFRRDFLRAQGLSYDTGLAIGEDFQLVAECLVRGARYDRLRLAGYVYSRREGSLSHRLSPGQLEAISTADTDFLGRFKDRLTPSERAAIAARRASVDTAAAFNRIIDAMKRRQIGRVLLEATHHPAAVLLFRLPIAARIARLRRGQTRPG
jgi:succinoglycan biosynthesis protein ExoO